MFLLEALNGQYLNVSCVLFFRKVVQLESSMKSKDLKNK